MPGQRTASSSDTLSKRTKTVTLNPITTDSWTKTLSPASLLMAAIVFGFHVAQPALGRGAGVVAPRPSRSHRARKCRAVNDILRIDTVSTAELNTIRATIRQRLITDSAAANMITPPVLAPSSPFRARPTAARLVSTRRTGAGPLSSQATTRYRPLHAALPSKRAFRNAPAMWARYKGFARYLRGDLTP